MTGDRNAIFTAAVAKSQKRSSDSARGHKHKKHRSDDGQNKAPQLVDEAVQEPSPRPINFCPPRQVITVPDGSTSDIPFRPDWSITTDDTAMGDRTISREFVLKGVLPKDRTKLDTTPSSVIPGITYNLISTLSCYAGETAARLEEMMARLTREHNNNLELTELLKIEKEKSARLEVDLLAAGDEAKAFRAELENTKSEAEQAVDVYKNSQEHKDDLINFAAEYLLDGFEACKKEVAKLDPEFDLNQLQVPIEEDQDVEIDGGEEDNPNRGDDEDQNRDDES